MELHNFRRLRHLYSAGRPSLWALAHILVSTSSHLGDRAFAAAGPRLWNSLPTHMSVSLICPWTLFTGNWKNIVRCTSAYYRQHCAKRNLPVFNLLRGRFWGFSPRRGDTLHRLEFCRAIKFRDKIARENRRRDIGLTKPVKLFAVGARFSLHVLVTLHKPHHIDVRMSLMSSLKQVSSL